MNDDAQLFETSATPDNDPRITKAGKFLRKYKIDEIPQLINVIKGEMSIVGPRPQIKWSTNEYSKEIKDILKVRPGITDYASIKFFSEGEILAKSSEPKKLYTKTILPEKIRLSVKYTQNISFYEDIKIILLTFLEVLKRK